MLDTAKGGRNPARWSVALGLRQGEALGLLWNAVDLDGDDLAGCWRSGGEFVAGPDPPRYSSPHSPATPHRRGGLVAVVAGQPR